MLLVLGSGELAVPQGHSEPPAASPVPNGTDGGESLPEAPWSSEATLSQFKCWADRHIIASKMPWGAGT